MNGLRSLQQKYKKATHSLTKQIQKTYHQLDSPEIPTETNEETIQSVSYDQLSWSIGAKVIVRQNGVINECIVYDISFISDKFKPHYMDIIHCYFNNGMIKTFNRYEIESDPIYLQNRRKLTQYCCVDKYSKSKQKWIHSYIDNYAQLNENTRACNGLHFSVNGTNYARWSCEIRCNSYLLQLKINSYILIFDADMQQWCYGKIINVIQSTQNKQRDSKWLDLNIFKVCYRKNDRVYVKYIHQFSASIALMNQELHTEHALIDEDMKSTQRIDLDETDLKYYKLLLQGFMQSHYINNDIIHIVIAYMGMVYGFVMVMESKTWEIAMDNKNENIDDLPLFYDSSSNETPTPNEYIVNTDLIPRTNCNFSSKTNGNLDIIYEESKMFKSHQIKNSALNPDASPFVLSNNKRDNIANIAAIIKRHKYKAKKRGHNPYQSKMIQNIQKRIKIPYGSTEYASKCIVEDISDIFYYMSVIHALQLQLAQNNNKDKIKIFNYNLHNKHTKDMLYGIALRHNSHSRGYDWILLDKLFCAKDILYGWNIRKCILPSITYLPMRNGHKIKAILLHNNIFKQIIKNTNWCRIAVYRSINNKNRLVFKPTKEEFIKQGIKYIEANNNINLIPILMTDNNTYSIEYLYILQIQKNDFKIDIGVAFKYDINNKYKVRVNGIHISGQYIIKQHKLADPQCKCKYLNNFKSHIDDINIGNPDCILNKLRAAEQRIKQFTQNN